MNALNKKHQTRVNKASSWLLKYNNLDNERNVADGMGDERLYNKLDRQCERAFNKYLEAIEELPKREIENIEKQLY